MQESDGNISFDILGENFTIKSDVPGDYFLGLVQNLNSKVKKLKVKFPNLSNIKLVIFAALDYADELKQLGNSTIDKEAIIRISDLSESLASAMEEE